jgi:hypothetical protein
VALAGGPVEDAVEARLEAAGKRSIHPQTPAGTVGPIARSGQ